MRFQIKSYIAQDGERFCQLYDNDEPGFPLFYPTAYLTRAIRLRTRFGTQLVYLEAVKRLLEWEAQKSCELEVQFLKRQFLKPYEIDDLAQHLRAARRGRLEQTIGADKGNTYIRVAADYLTWLATELITDADRPEIAQMIQTQKRRLDDKADQKSGSKSEIAQKVSKKHLAENAREQLLTLFHHPFIELFHNSDKGSRLRNVVMLRILYETGMRRGELLSLKLKHIRESSGGSIACLVIEKNHNDVYDTRLIQPVVKTLGRIVPITPCLEQQIFEYITEHRATLPRVGFDDNDFIFVNDRPGRAQGKPISVSTFNQAVVSLRTLFPAMRVLHPHLLRHDWNFRFSAHAKKGGLSLETQTALREELMGWQPESDMAIKYNKRHIEEQSLHFGLEIANDTQRRSTTSVIDNEPK